MTQPPPPEAAGFALHATAPTRMDLAGGTLDLWPLFALEGGAWTVNAALAIPCEVWLVPRTGGVRLVSVDADAGAAAEAPTAAQLPDGGPLDLVVRAVRHLDPGPGLQVVTRSGAPHGSGLGASSALLVALLAALARFTGRRLRPAALVDLAHNLEAQSIGIPTGTQDYWAAIGGGVNALWYGLDGFRRERLDAGPGAGALRRLLETWVVLSFTGASRASARANWNMLRAYCERHPGTPQRFRAIRDLAAEARAALQGAADPRRLAEVVAAEWAARRQLAEGVTTPAVEAQMAAAARAGALASKLCGAGGGGCMITLVSPGRRTAVQQALAAAGARILPFRVARRGLTVRRARG